MMISTLVADTMDVKEGDVVIDVGNRTGSSPSLLPNRAFDVCRPSNNSPDVEEVVFGDAVHGVADGSSFHAGALFDPLDEDVEAT